MSRLKSKFDPVTISGGRGGKFGSFLLLFLFVVKSCRASAVLGNLHLDKTAGKLYSLNHVAVFKWALEEVRPESKKLLDTGIQDVSTRIQALSQVL